MKDKLISKLIKDIDQRTWKKICNRAAAEGKTPEAVASSILQKGVGTTF